MYFVYILVCLQTRRTYVGPSLPRNVARHLPRNQTEIVRAPTGLGATRRWERSEPFPVLDSPGLPEDFFQNRPQFFI